jgi:hypothetical protein
MWILKKKCKLGQLILRVYKHYGMNRDKIARFMVLDAVVMQFEDF